jgi:diguanylate cyclase (GGDEF)-like protein
MVHKDTDIRRLSEMHRLLHDAIDQIIVSRDFREVAAALLVLTQGILPATALEFYARDLDGQTLYLGPSNRYRGSPDEVPGEWAGLLDLERPADPTDLPITTAEGSRAIGVPLFSPTSGRSTGVAILRLSEPTTIAEAAVAALAEVSTPLEVAVERELLLRSIELRRSELYDLAMRDALTGLHNRLFLADAAERLLALHDRGEIDTVVATMFDLDHFKVINDTYGHAAGDEVLRRFGRLLADDARAADIVTRIGGEEFLALQVTNDPHDAENLARRVLATSRRLTFPPPLDSLHLTASAGVAVRRPREPLDDLVGRSDRALYQAKEAGRDQVACAPSAGA